MKRFMTLTAGAIPAMAAWLLDNAPLGPLAPYVFGAMMGRKPQRRKCSPQSQQGQHGLVIGGLGGMGDAELCTRCGYEYYPTFTPSQRGRSEQWRETTGKPDWPMVEAARSLNKQTITGEEQ
jgi:hypothetical protein